MSAKTVQKHFAENFRPPLTKDEEAILRLRYMPISHSVSCVSIIKDPKLLAIMARHINADVRAAVENNLHTDRDTLIRLFETWEAPSASERLIESLQEEPAVVVNKRLSEQNTATGQWEETSRFTKDSGISDPENDEPEDQKPHTMHMTNPEKLARLPLMHVAPPKTVARLRR